MKKLLLLLMILFTGYIAVLAQAPGLLNYQGVARNSLGNVISNKSISLRLTIHDATANGPSEYSETRTVVTNPFGLFNVQVGSTGAVSQMGTLTGVDWSSGRKYMQVEIDPEGGNNFLNVGTTELASVPFALYSQSGLPIGPASADLTGAYPGPTVAKIRGVSVSTIAPASNYVLGFDGTNWTPTNMATHPDNYWRLSGNHVFNTNTANIGIGINTPSYKLDISTAADNDGIRVSGTNGNLRFRLNNTSGGKEYSLLTGGAGSAFGQGNFAITDVSAGDAVRFLISGTTGHVAIGGGNLNPAERLWVNGAARFTNNADFEKTIRVTDSIISSRVKISGSSSDYIAVFENTFNGNGDGIQIRLGKTHPAWTGSAFINVPNPVVQGLETQINQIRRWVYGEENFRWQSLINLMPSQYLTGTVCNLTNYITTKINTAVGLPVGTPAYDVGYAVVNGLNQVADALIRDEWVDDVRGKAVIPAFQFPSIPQLGCDSLPTLTWPVLAFSNVNNSLTKENEFISFADKDGRKLGAIRAQSVQDFSFDYFDGVKLLSLADQMIGIDLVKDFMGVVAGVSEMVADYNSIGVEYSSGNGDYAEWLEREDHREMISAGDIVAVKGGKITKDLTGAEQIMAVSYRPIVLGNMPDKDQFGFGNTIAFMGQIPVKVMGPVRAGDYIVAKSGIKGYGVAVHPKDMTVDDFKLSVGRSWDTNTNTGPKTVNTVVGVHNHDFLNIISGLQKRTEDNELRLKAIEAKLNMVPGVKTQAGSKGF